MFTAVLAFAGHNSKEAMLCRMEFPCKFHVPNRASEKDTGEVKPSDRVARTLNCPCKNCTWVQQNRDSSFTFYLELCLPSSHCHGADCDDQLHKQLDQRRSGVADRSMITLASEMVSLRCLNDTNSEYCCAISIVVNFIATLCARRTAQAYSRQVKQCVLFKQLVRPEGSRTCYPHS